MTQHIEFGNDKSRLLRGLAIILMVSGHSFPGCVIPFAVPIFSFLVGYGYAFARGRSLLHAFQRIRHLLVGFWWILFLICVPVGIFYTHYKFEWWQIGLNMFGLWGGFNFYCWYIYFYIFSMLVMPLASRLIDKGGIMAVVLIWGAFIGADQLIAHTMPAQVPLWLNALSRCVLYFPIVAVGYWWARYNIFSKISFSGRWLPLVISAAVAAGVYALRWWEPVRILDPVLTPVFAGAVATVFRLIDWTPLNVLFTELGLKSMNIWFLHALFFTHSTRGLFLPLVNWIHPHIFFIAAVIVLSYIMSVAIDQVKKVPELLYLRLRRAFA